MRANNQAKFLLTRELDLVDRFPVLMKSFAGNVLGTTYSGELLTSNAGTASGATGVHDYLRHVLKQSRAVSPSFPRAVIDQSLRKRVQVKWKEK